MPTPLYIYDVGDGDLVTGSAADEFIIAFAALGTSSEILNGGDGDDYILGDSAENYNTGTTNSLASPYDIDGFTAWTVDENPFFGDSNIPHQSLYVLADAGQTHYSSLWIGAGETLTIDIDFGNEHPIGVDSDMTVEIYTAAGELLTSNDDGVAISLGGAGSLSGFDPYLTFVNTTGVAAEFIIRFREFGSSDAGVFEGGETFVANLSVTGHAVVGATVMGNDVINGGNGNDTLAGQGGDDVINGDADDDLLYGGSGDDTLAGGAGNDSLAGGDGADTASYVAAGSAVHVDLTLLTAQDTLGAGIDTLGGIERVIGSSFADTLVGDDGGNSLTGGDGNDTLSGGAGGDTLFGGNGNDSINGGDGIDFANYAGIAGPVRVDLALGGAQDTLGAGIDTLTAIENVVGSSFADTLSGNGSANALNGSGGNDILRGAGGNDNVIGGEGNDALDGGAGNDALNGGNGIDVALYAGATSAVRVNLGIAVAQDTLGAGSDSLFQVENIIGSAFNDTLIGNTGANSLNGYGGNDVVYGGSGNDSLLGGEGNDALDGGLGNDALNGGNGIDGASYAAATAAVRVNLGVVAAQNTLGAGTDTLTAIENVSGSNFNDVLTGNNAANAINGNNGNDVVYGGSGNDVVLGGEGDDAVDGGLGNDVINGGNGVDLASYAAAASGVSVNLGIAAGQNTVSAGIDTLVAIENVAGSDHNDTLVGSSGNNSIYGASGDDVINGRAGNDSLFGAAGLDSFRFDTPLNAATNVDTLGDFVVAHDTILLSTAIFSAIGAGTLNAAAFQLGVAANDAGDRIIYDSATGRIFYDADGTGAGAQTLFARVAAGTALTNADFVAQAPAAEAFKSDAPMPIWHHAWRGPPGEAVGMPGHGHAADIGTAHADYFLA